MAITVHDEPERHRYQARDGDRLAGVLVYRDDTAGVRVLAHTEVRPEFEGRGVGGELARAALTAARDQGYRIDPRCPFVAGYLTRHPEFQDVVIGG